MDAQTETTTATETTKVAETPTEVVKEPVVETKVEPSKEIQELRTEAGRLRKQNEERESLLAER